MYSKVLFAMEKIKNSKEGIFSHYDGKFFTFPCIIKIMKINVLDLITKNYNFV
jgi:hypothetical protein